MCTCGGGNVGRKGKVKNKGRGKDLTTCGIKLLGRRYRVQIWCLNSPGARHSVSAKPTVVIEAGTAVRCVHGAYSKVER